MLTYLSCVFQDSAVAISTDTVCCEGVVVEVSSIYSNCRTINVYLTVSSKPCICLMFVAKKCSQIFTNDV